MRKILLLLCASSIVSCSHTVSPIKDIVNPTKDTASPTVVIAKTIKPRWETVKAHPEWTGYARESLWEHGQYLLTGELKDIGDFSTKKVTDREEFMIFLLSLMVEKESYFDPSSEYKENFKDRHGRYVISTGLFQISLESSNGSRYKCGMKSQADLKDPRKNIECSVKILNALVKENARLAGRVSRRWKGGARYWSVLRKGHSPYNFIVKEMKKKF